MAGKTRRKKAPGKRAGKRTAVVASDSAIRALASPLRMEILQAFTSVDERLTVADISERIAKPRGSLYYHVRKLAEIGVLVEVERRRSGRRHESVYSVAAERIAVAADPSSGKSRSATTKLVLSMLRQAGREFETALRDGWMDDRDGTEMGFRQRARLTDADIEKVQSLFARIEEICRKATKRKRGRPYSITALGIPLGPDDTEP